MKYIRMNFIKLVRDNRIHKKRTRRTIFIPNIKDNTVYNRYYCYCLSENRSDKDNIIVKLSCIHKPINLNGIIASNIKENTLHVNGNNDTLQVIEDQVCFKRSLSEVLTFRD